DGRRRQGPRDHGPRALCRRAGDRVERQRRGAGAFLARARPSGGGRMMRFGSRLAAAMDANGPLCFGIDPHPGLLDSWGLTDDADGLAAFVDIALSAFAGTGAAIKPQSAFFERHGSKGIAVL